MDRVIYLKDKKRKSNNNIFFKKYPNMIIYSGIFNKLYKGEIYNPPFFNVIISEYIMNNIEIKMLWNMLLSNGYLIILKSNAKFFNKSQFKENKDFIIIKKDTPYINIIYDKSRIIDFMIIGVQKGGTSAAMTNLEKHHNIHIPFEEIHYYENDWFEYNLEKYKSKFDYTKKLVGEKDPNIIFMPHIYPLIQKLNPYIKMILFLRNPIDRAYSAWYMFNTKYVNSKDNLMSFEDSMKNELNNRIDEPLNYRVSNSHYLQRGLYYKQIKELLRYFPRENVYICLSEKVINEMDVEYKKIYDFLNIEYPKEDLNYEKRFVGTYDIKDKNNDISNSFYKKLVKFYKDDVNKLEKEILGYKTNWF
jgi:hypothetical protein